MVYKLDSIKVLKATDCIIKDADKKFDECLVEKFLDYIEAELKDFSTDHVFRSRALVRRVVHFIDHKDFVMMNQARAYKMVLVMLRSTRLSFYNNGFHHLQLLLDSFWKSLSLVIVNNETAALTIVLQILEYMARFVPSQEWLMSKTIDPPLKIQRYGAIYEIQDVPSIVKFYIETSNNYHTKNKAEQLLQSLIVGHHYNKLPINHSWMDKMRRTIKDLVLTGCPSITSILIDVLRNKDKYKIDKHILLRRYDLVETIQESFSLMIEKNNRKCNINNLCKCLALTSPPKNFKSVVEKLKSRNHLDGIIVYLVNFHIKDSSYNQQLLTYLLYPILSKCDGDETAMLIRKLLATRDERDFIDNNNNIKIITLCLVQVNQILNDKSQTLQMSIRTLKLISQTAINYILCHNKSQHNHKNLMECCNALLKLQMFCGGNIDFIQDSALDPLQTHLLSSITNIVQTVQENYDENDKPKLISLLKVLRHAQRSANILGPRLRVSKDSLNVYWSKIVELAFKTDDHDIMNEYALYFVFTTSQEGLEEEYDRYVELIWQHMFLNARNTENRELLGHLSNLLIDIDVKVQAPVLHKHEIRRYHDIPKALGQILVENQSVVPTVDLIIEALDYTRRFPGLKNNNLTIGYVSRLDSPCLPDTVRPCLDGLAVGLCETVKGDARDTSRQKALKLISELTEEMITNSDDTYKILTRLTKTNILTTLHEVSTGSLYCSLMYNTAMLKVKLINTAVILKLENAKQIMLDELEIPRKVVDFYVEKSYSRVTETSLRLSDDRVALSSLVDDILHYDTLTDGISDCY